MDIQGFIVPILMNTPQLRAKIQGICQQPVDHVMKCVSGFMDQLNSGPGLIDKGLVMQQRFQQVYSAGLRMGFSDWESQLCAADCAGYKLIDVATSFAQRRGWDCSIEQLQNLHNTIMPRFMKRGRQVGLFQPQQESKTKQEGIPVTSGNQTRGGTPPWRDKVAEPVKSTVPEPAK